MAARTGDRRRDLAVSGHVNVDRFLRVRRAPAADRTVPILAVEDRLGGTATNLALVAARGGVRVGLISRVGDGFPGAFRTRLRAAGVDLGGLATVVGTATPTCYTIEEAGGVQRTLIDQGPMGTDAGPAVARSWLRRHSWIHLGTGPPGAQLDLAAAARDEGMRVAADPAQEIFYRWERAPFLRLLDRSEILFGNRAEIARAVRLAGAAGPRGLLPRVPTVVRTEGANGATAFTRAGREHVRSVRPARLRTLVGAGDAFRGGFYAGFFAGARLPECLAAGARAAARWVAAPG